MIKNNNFDVIIVGGSYAGLSAAMTLGRSLRDVLLIDAGNPCNKQTPHSHNFITQDGAPPASISAIAKEQVLAYPKVQFLQDTAKRGLQTNNRFEIITESGQSFQSRKLIFATGIKDILPEIEGFADCWGKTVIHCPYCHGYEVKKQKTGIFNNGDEAFETAKLISNWTKDLAIFTNGKSKLSEEQTRKLQQKNISIIEKPITSVVHENGYMERLKFEDSTTMALNAIYVRVPFKQHSNIPTELGCALDEHGYLMVDSFQKTNIPSIYACGDNTTFIRSVAQAVYAGNLAGAMVNREMIETDWE
ncbi:NAD(P)/FAD-dependent oxidoreductase [Aquimarina sp. U1-2]|uniref:NAD(P)/FAD-dependent oxidoreductase n=1 Tax=Aquimarina sp. U1-2 TaxID=2823141 RepID=UPI001AED0AD2|nr:NAD(P)/FAD-dependent oxidoreductase [Aquimarina sp. U1-2]MBP2833451.1 NAD(P)/FAD-dependent oxidoreductase [Aquimarina sp. U1-2]